MVFHGQFMVIITVFHGQIIVIITGITGFLCSDHGHDHGFPWSDHCNNRGFSLGKASEKSEKKSLLVAQSRLIIFCKKKIRIFMQQLRTDFFHPWLIKILANGIDYKKHSLLTKTGLHFSVLGRVSEEV